MSRAPNDGSGTVVNNGAAGAGRIGNEDVGGHRVENCRGENDRKGGAAGRARHRSAQLAAGATLANGLAVGSDVVCRKRC